MNALKNSENGKIQVWTSKNVLGEDIEWGNNGYFEDGYDEFDNYEDALAFITAHKKYLFSAEIAGKLLFNRGLKIDLLKS